jgi:hypothetical protein
MVITKECGLESEKERKNKEKCVNGATFLTSQIFSEYPQQRLTLLHSHHSSYLQLTYSLDALINSYLLAIVRLLWPTSTFIPIQLECLHCIEFD